MAVYTERADDAERGESVQPYENKLLQYRDAAEVKERYNDQLHIYAGGAVCDTDTRGFQNPGNRSLTEIVVDASEGFVPLWDVEVTLRWRFQELALQQFSNADEIRQYVRNLLAKGILQWEDATPIAFKEAEDAWDFELVVMAANKCSPLGCTLASAFFPSPGQHQLRVYPMMFQQSPEEQVETMAHEVGHIFGLRHFFAKVSEDAWPSEIFGEHSKFSIMNYGADSIMSPADREDLKNLYKLAWAGLLTQINGTPIRLLRPFSSFRVPFSTCDPLLHQRPSSPD